jgi:hypothetical protein
MVAIGSLVGSAIAGRSKKKPASPHTRPGVEYLLTRPGLRQQAQGEMAKRQQVPRPYQGTRLGVHKKVTGQVLELHRRIAADFNKQDPMPDYRAEHFAWIKETYDAGAAITGWFGMILDVAPDGGSYLVTASIGPHVHAPGRGGVPFFGSCLTETYRYLPTTGQFVFLDTKPHAHGPPGYVID